MLKKLFKFLTRKRKADNQAVSVTTETEQKENFMENEKEVVETKTEEEVKPTENEVKEETKTEEVKEETQPVEESTATENVVSETEDVGNGISIDQVVTKDILKDALDSLNAKLDAILDENKKLKTELANKESEVNGYKDKYEKSDFGNTATKGVKAEEKKYSSFDEYSKQFM